MLRQATSHETYMYMSFVKCIHLVLIGFVVCFLNSCEQKQNIVVQNNVVQEPQEQNKAQPQNSNLSGINTQPILSMKVEPSTLSLQSNQEVSLKKIFLVRADKNVSELESIKLLDEIISSDPSVATVSKEGVIKSVKSGVSIIILKLGNITQTVVVSVVEPPTEVSSPSPSGSGIYKSIHTDKESYTIKPFDTAKIVLSAQMNTSELTALIDNQKATWRSSAPDIATISEQGLVTAWKIGSSTMTVNLEGLVKSFYVIVSNEPAPMNNSKYNSIGLDKVKYELKIAGTAQVTISVILTTGEMALINDPTQAEWSSFNPEIANISSAGLITARAIGETSMTVKFGGLTKTFLVTVTAP